MGEAEIMLACLERVRRKYDRRGRSELWSDDTREDFLRAFRLVPLSHLEAVVEEVLLHPPTDDRGREVNWLPEPSDVVRVAQQMTLEGNVTASSVVSEILDAIQRYGLYGRSDPENPNVCYEGVPPLSEVAALVVSAMGGWGELCRMEAPTGVLNGLLLKHAENAVKAERQRPLVASRRLPIAPRGLQAIGKGDRH